jgi:hypothetical protein
MLAEVAVLEFHQYGSTDPDDRLLMFAALATDLSSWAGVPRKGWRVRMLYQRWISEQRQQEVIDYWEQVSKPNDELTRKYLVGPNAITAAIFDEPVLVDGKLVMSYERPFRDDDSPAKQLAACAGVVMARMVTRLTSDEYEILQDPDRWTEDEFGHNYVLESLTQIKSVSEDADKFISDNSMTSSDVQQLISSLEALCRPALIVDGQHRLFGAANCSRSSKIWLPVVAIPNSPWMEQIYQFVLINEKAKKVEPSLLTDIFGSSLTPSEQTAIRLQLEVAGASVDPRIAAVIAARDPSSPFLNMVKIQLDGDPPGGLPGYIPEVAIRQLIDGGRGARGWRNDDEFYEKFVRPTFPDRAQWDTWTDGAWRDYWFTFWATVRDWYNAQQKDKDTTPLWSAVQSNLTKAVSLRLFQRLFMEQAIARVDRIEESRETIISLLRDNNLDDSAVDAKIAEQVATVAIPDNTDDFAEMVRTWFLTNGVPVRVFELNWVSSLDDAAGQSFLYEEFEDAFKESKDPKKVYRAQNQKVFTTEDK